MTSLLSMLDRFEQAAVTYETSTAKADRDELHAARRAIMEAFEAGGMSGPELRERLYRIRLYAQDALDNGWLSGGAVGNMMSIRDEVHAITYALSASPQPAPVTAAAVLASNIIDAVEGCSCDACVAKAIDIVARALPARPSPAIMEREAELVAEIAALSERNFALVNCLDDLKMEAAATLSEREAELVKALEPFAKAANPYDGVKCSGALWGDDGLTIGHLRAARAALNTSLEQE